MQLRLLLKVRLNVFCGSWGTETSLRMLCLKGMLKSILQMDRFQDFPLLAGAAGAAATAEACQESS